MATITREFHLDRSADEVWKGFADVGNVNQLIDYLGEVTVEGNTRTCSMGDAGMLEELIVSVDDDARRLAYSVRKSPFDLQHHSASVQIHPDGDGARAVWVTDVLPDALAGALAEPIDAAVDSITRYYT